MLASKMSLKRAFTQNQATCSSNKSQKSSLNTSSWSKKTRWTSAVGSWPTRAHWSTRLMRLYSEESSLSPLSQISNPQITNCSSKDRKLSSWATWGHFCLKKIPMANLCSTKSPFCCRTLLNKIKAPLSWSWSRMEFRATSTLKPLAH